MSDLRGVSIPILLFLSHWSFESRHFSSFVCVIFFHINFFCDQPQARLVASKFSRLFWGEQPPFTPIGRGGRYFFGRNRMTKLMTTPFDVRMSSADSSFVIRH